MGDAEVVNRILRCKNFYDVLQVPQSATEDELKRAYKKLALATHPDKNKASGAEDAFKAVGKAFSTLSDPQKRAVYDRYGEDGLQRALSGASAKPTARHHYAQQYEFEGDDIYDLFAQMFGADPRGRGHYYSTSSGGRYTYAASSTGGPFFRAAAQRGTPYGRYAQQPPPNHQPQEATAPAWVMRLFQLLPMLLFFAVFLLFSTTSQQPQLPYSLSFDQVGGYTKKRYTREHHIAYFVPPGFDTQRDPAALFDLEQHVYHGYLDHLNRRCKYEQQEKGTLQQRARFYYSGKTQKEMLEKANNHPTKSCSDLQSLISQFGQQRQPYQHSRP